MTSEVRSPTSGERTSALDLGLRTSDLGHLAVLLQAEAALDFPREADTDGSSDQAHEDPAGHVGRVGNPDLDSRVSYPCSHQEEREGQRAIEGGEEEGLSGDVRGVTRGKREGVSAADEEPDSLQGLTGTGPLDPELDQVLRRTGHEEQHQGRHDCEPSLPASPDEERDSRTRKRDEKGLGIGNDRHQEIEEGITEIPVDRPEEEEVKGSHPAYRPHSPPDAKERAGWGRWGLAGP